MLCFFKLLFILLNFVFIFGMGNFLGFPYLHKLAIPQSRQDRTIIVVASLIFPLSYTGGFQTHPDNIFCSVIHFLHGFLTQAFLRFGI